MVLLAAPRRLLMSFSSMPLSSEWAVAVRSGGQENFSERILRSSSCGEGVRGEGVREGVSAGVVHDAR